MRRSILLAYILLICLFLTACASYTIENEKFSSSSEAIQKQLQTQSQVLSEIQPTDSSINGNALIIFPNDNEIMRNHIRYGNNPSKIQMDQIDFLLTASKNNFQFYFDAIAKRKVFTSVSKDIHNGAPASFLNDNFDFIIFYDIDGWFIKGNKHPKPLLISIDFKIPLKQRTVMFLNLLSENAHSIISK